MFDFLKKNNAPKSNFDEFDIICPKCMLRMEKVMRGDVILDVCKVCGGTWFDKDEIEKLFMHLKNKENDEKQVSPKKTASKKK